MLAQAEPNRESVIRAELDLDALFANRQTGAAPTFRDRRRRAALYRQWPSHLARKEYIATVRSRLDARRLDFAAVRISVREPQTLEIGLVQAAH